MRCIDLLGIHAPALCVWVLLLMEVLWYSASNMVMRSKYAIGIMYDFYPGLPHMLSLSRSLVQTLCGMTHKVVSLHNVPCLCPPKCTLMAFFPWWKVRTSIHCLSVYHSFFARMLNPKSLYIMITCLTFCSAIRILDHAGPYSCAHFVA